jgi:DNA-binding beta-propeller fold protein YncE
MRNKQEGSAAMVVLIIILVLALGFAFWWVWYQNRDNNDDNGGDDTPDTVNMRIENVGFATPESMLYDSASDVYLVSNINGAPLDSDGNGFISRVNPDGTVADLKWIDGASEGVDLDAPKGMAILGDELYIADINVVRVFNRNSGEMVRTVGITGATFLNGVAASNDTVYVTDSGLDASFEDTGTDGIYKVTGDSYETMVLSTELNNPNGVAVHSDGQQLMVASFGGNGVFHVNADGTFDQTATLPEGTLDGLVWETNDEVMLVSSWDADAVYRVNHDSGDSTVLFSDLTDPADLGLDTKRNRLLVPLFNDDAVVIRTIE